MIFEKNVRVEFCDINVKNQVLNRGLLRLMQEVASYHSDSVGYGINDVASTNMSWVLINQRMKVFSRPCWGTDLKVKTWSRGSKGAFCLRDFEVYDSKGELVCTASSSWTIVNAKTGSIIKPSHEIIDVYGTEDKSVFNDSSQRLREPDNSRKTFEYKIQKRDIDINNHVNNLFYLDFAEEALPLKVCEKLFNCVEIYYKKATKLEDSIICFYADVDDEYVVTIKSTETGHVHALIKLS